MVLAASLIITAIAIGLLVVYGADVAVGYGSEDGQGFIPFDHKTRGMGLGLPALILPIIAFFISRKEPSKTLGGMIIVAGILIIIGGAVVIGNADPEEVKESGRDVLSETIPLLVAGLIQIGLGILKIKKSWWKKMPTCAKCNNDVKKVYDCDHTDFEEYCVECYTELHYYLTEKD